MALLPSRPTFVTAAWMTLNLVPLLAAALVWLVFGSWFWGLLLVILYPLYFVLYGFFIAMPLMVRLFRQPASLHKQ